MIVAVASFSMFRGRGMPWLLGYSVNLHSVSKGTVKHAALEFSIRCGCAIVAAFVQL